MGGRRAGPGGPGSKVPAVGRGRRGTVRRCGECHLLAHLRIIRIRGEAYCNVSGCNCRVDEVLQSITRRGADSLSIHEHHAYGLGPIAANGRRILGTCDRAQVRCLISCPAECGSCPRAIEPMVDIHLLVGEVIPVEVEGFGDWVEGGCPGLGTVSRARGTALGCRDLDWLVPG